jgi:hypothetical protein
MTGACPFRCVQFFLAYRKTLASTKEYEYTSSTGTHSHDYRRESGHTYIRVQELVELVERQNVLRGVKLDRFVIIYLCQLDYIPIDTIQDTYVLPLTPTGL